MASNTSRDSLLKSIEQRKEEAKNRLRELSNTPQKSAALREKAAAVRREIKELENKKNIVEYSKAFDEPLPQDFSTFAANAAAQGQLSPTPPRTKEKPEKLHLPPLPSEYTSRIESLTPQSHHSIYETPPSLSDISTISDVSDIRSPSSSIFAESYEEPAGATPSDVFFPPGSRNTPVNPPGKYRGVFKSEPSVASSESGGGWSNPFSRLVRSAFSSRTAPEVSPRTNTPSQPPRPDYFSTPTSARRNLQGEFESEIDSPPRGSHSPYIPLPPTPQSGQTLRQRGGFSLTGLRGDVTTTYNRGIEHAQRGLRSGYESAQNRWYETPDETKTKMKYVAGGAAAAAGSALAAYLIKKLFYADGGTGDGKETSSCKAPTPEKIDGAGKPSETVDGSNGQTYPSLDLGGTTAEAVLQNELQSAQQGGNTSPGAAQAQIQDAMSSLGKNIPPPSVQKESNPHIANANTPGGPAPSLPGPYAAASATSGVGTGAAAPPPSATAEGGGTAQKAEGPDMNRVDPITPQTGAQQTPSNANQNISIQKFAEDVKGSLQTLGPAEVFGDARERANMGKGADDPHAYAGPYDAPTFPGGKADTELTLMGAWKTRGGNTSHLYFGNKNSKGGARKSAKYMKWSEKNGGNWRKMTKNQAMNVFSKPNRLQGGYFLDQPTAGTMLPDILGATLKRKQQDVGMAMEGAQKMEMAKGVKNAPPPMKKQRVL